MAANCGFIALVGLVMFGAVFLRLYSFGQLAATVTEKVRLVLYRSILQKDMSFFDREENRVENLADALNSDAEILNGAGLERAAPVLEGLFAVAVSCAFAFG